jgi:hypothetical protein
MANSNNNANRSDDAILGKSPVPCHEYDNWLLGSAKASPDAQFASAVVDVANGARAIATIISEHLVDLNAIVAGAGKHTRPLLNESDVEALGRLAVFSLDQLHEMASNQVDRLNSLAEGAAK